MLVSGEREKEWWLLGDFSNWWFGDIEKWSDTVESFELWSGLEENAKRMNVKAERLKDIDLELGLVFSSFGEYERLTVDQNINE